jgi:hypothetical protein
MNTPRCLHTANLSRYELKKEIDFKRRRSSESYNRTAQHFLQFLQKRLVLGTASPCTGPHDTTHLFLFEIA